MTSSTNTTSNTTSTVASGSYPKVSHPDKFDFCNPGAWSQWRRRFERYMSVSGQDKKTDEEKIDLLLYIMGDESEEILVTFSPKPTTYNAMLTKFENHFVPKHNVIFERFKFNSRRQLPGESIDSFIRSLYSLVESCSYDTFDKSQAIRDRIVEGMSDKKTSDRMQLQASLSLEEAVRMAKQAEIQVQQSKEMLNGHRQVAKMNADPSRQYSKKNEENGKNETGKCWFCGLQQKHEREKCPAKKSVCNKCKRIGHWAVMCRASKKVRSIHDETPESPEDNDFLGSLSINTLDSKEWVVDLHVTEFNKTLEFLVDSGADITCVPSSSIYNSVLSNLCPNVKTISGPSGNLLKVLGTYSVEIIHQNDICSTDIYVIKDLTKPILGRPEIVMMKLLQFADGVGLRSTEKSIRVVQSTVSSSLVLEKYPELFSSVGTFKTEMKIRLKDGVKPFAQTTPRIVPIPLLEPLKQELERLKKLNIIEPIEDYTPWVSPIVVVNKHSKIRLCVDYTKLNQAVLRSYFPIGKVENILARVRGSQYFSKLDTNSGFYQIKLSEESQPLTTFITPFGRYFFKRVPFGISCAPEYFSILLNKILSGIEGVISHMDDMLIHAKSLEEHNRILYEVLDRIKAEGITLNKDKCIFCVQSLNFLGHSLSNEGISIDPSRIESISRFPQPSNKNELLQFLGLMNFSSRFLPNRSQVLEPLTTLLKKHVQFVWDVAQKESFEKIKQLLQNSPCLSYFDPTKQVVVSSDASSYGLGSCLYQLSKDGKKEIIAYASRLLSATESRYAQIEREAVAIAWSADKFKEYIIGIPIIFETDHKPLVQILQTKPIDELTPRLQRFRIRLMRYDYQIHYVPGKNLTVADALSRNFPKNSKEPKDDELAHEAEAHVKMVIQSVQIKPPFLEEIKKEQDCDPICQKLKQFSLSDWPDKSKLDVDLLPYYQYRFDISFQEGFLIKNTRIIVPQSLQLKCIEFIHQGHQGVVKCRDRAKASVWWLGLSTQIENMIKNCPECIEHRINPKEPFLKENFPERPWQKIALDLEKCNGVWYLVVTDYFSRFFEIFRLTKMTESVIIIKLKQLFSHYGIPDQIRSDNGPQFQSEFREFARKYDFHFETSSPKYPASNGEVESAVKTAKTLIKKNPKDLDLALLSYRTTPLACGLSPAELLMNRKLRSHLPVLPSILNKTVNSDHIPEKENVAKEKLAHRYNKRHRTRELSKLFIGDSVWITDIRQYGKVVAVLEQPRSYLIETSFGKYRRNRWHLIPAPHYNSNDQNQTPAPTLGLDCDFGQQTNSNENESESCDYKSPASVETRAEASTSLDKNNNVPIRKSTRNVKPPSRLKDYVL